MKSTLKSITFIAALLFLAAAQAAAATVLLGTTGAGATPSTLFQIDPANGAPIRQIGPVGGVGYTVNGLAWDAWTQTLYATTSVRDKHFHGLITINIATGVGTPVDASVENFGLGPVDPITLQGSPVHSISVDFLGRMVGWYDEVPAGSDTFVRIDKRTGIATEFTDTGIDTAQNGLSFSDFNILWNIDSPLQHPDGTFTQTAYILNPLNGKPIFSRPLSPPTAAALGDFSPVNNNYYGLNFNVLSGTPLEADLVMVNPRTGVVTTLGRTVDGLHTVAFARPFPRR